MKAHGLTSKKPETRRIKLDCQCGIECGRQLEISACPDGNWELRLSIRNLDSEIVSSIEITSQQAYFLFGAALGTEKPETQRPAERQK